VGYGTSSPLVLFFWDHNKPEPVNPIADRGVFFDGDVPLRDVRFGLIIIVIRNKIGDGVIREERFKLAIKLGGKRFIVRHHQRRPVKVHNQIRHGERHAAPGDAHERLIFFAALDGADEFRYRVRLVAGRVEGGLEVEHEIIVLHKAAITRSIPFLPSQKKGKVRSGIALLYIINALTF